MTISFPNATRSYDPVKGRVRFWGYDGAIEVSFFLDDSALRKLCPATGFTEDDLLAAFDAVRKRIHSVAVKVYGRRRKGEYACWLSASDF